MSTYTADLKDSSSNSIRPITDWSAVQNAPDFASQIQSVLDIANGKIDKGDAVEYNQTPVINGSTDWNSITTEGLHLISTTGNIAGVHFPGSQNAAQTGGNWGFLLQVGHTTSTGLGVQFAMFVPGIIFIRAYSGSNGGAWGNWKSVNTTDAGV